ncbi:unnamed protein product [Acanthoscelides obtectus]|uniref:Uncharacterized protein n=1 Tax=Acanthoscelides obtectus TaxID=200917 RepID=A0A9P0PBA4_ACAOB|nr:unnamed protein product [Acanthoscelides obtectus]CAK1660509.1 hypothetical protein AOBTE_LOCUS22123 [Acanthoscelides obtectus]
MVKVQFVIVACFAAAALARQHPPTNNLENGNDEYINTDIEIVKNILNLFETAQDQEYEKKDDSDSTNEDIIEKIKKCIKQLVEKAKDRVGDLEKKIEQIIGDVSTIKDCKGSEEDKQKCIEKAIAALKQDVKNLIGDGSKQAQWIINEALPELVQCVRK